MASKAERQADVKQAGAAQAQQVVRDHLADSARDGTRRMLMQALQEELDAYLSRWRYERSGEASGAGRPFRGYRNGSTPRRLTLGAGTLDLAVPRVRDVPEDQPPFASKILRKHQRRSDTIDATYLNLFVQGLATRDFEPALRLLVGHEAPLSPSTISRLTRQFKAQYEAFDRQDLSNRTLV